MFKRCSNEKLSGLFVLRKNTFRLKTRKHFVLRIIVGACKALNTDYATSATGIAGPTGGTKDIPVGTIWLACGNAEKIVTLKVEEDHGRDINLAIATNKAMQMFLDYLKVEFERVSDE